MSQRLCRAVTVVGMLMLVSMLAPPTPSALATADSSWTGEFELEARTAQAGPVTIKVVLQPSDTSLAFLVTLDSHSVNLDRYDLIQLATVRIDQGPDLQPDRWDAPPG